MAHTFHLSVTNKWRCKRSQCRGGVD